METNHIREAVDHAAKKGLSWTKRSRLLNDCLCNLITLGRNSDSEKIIAECVTIAVSSKNEIITITITGNETKEAIHIGLRPDNGTLTLEGYPCDINAISQKVAQLLLSNKPQEIMQTLVYC